MQQKGKGLTALNLFCICLAMSIFAINPKK
jgi:hypothetical protein